jgi:acyl carrier protein
MVKIRGFQVEPGRIEAAIAALPAVAECAVLLDNTLAEESRLVAYWSAQPGKAITADTLQQDLRSKLPEHMIPWRFVQLNNLPLTPNGKIDRRRLPPLSRVRPAADIPYVAPRTATESVVARLWAEVLQLDQVGIYDSFVLLGGDSIGAMRIAAHIEEYFSIESARLNILTFATVDEMAAAIDRSTENSSVQESISAERILDDLAALSGAHRQAHSALLQ